MEKLLIIILILISGCIGGEPTARPQPVINIYNHTLQTTTTHLQKETTTTQLQKETTTTTSIIITTTTTTYTTTTIRRTAPRLNIPEQWRKCELHNQCLLFTDCCGINGRQYAVNRYRDQEFNQLKGNCNETLRCIVTSNLYSMRYKYAECQDGLCQKTYDFPTQQTQEEKNNSDFSNFKFNRIFS